MKRLFLPILLLTLAVTSGYSQCADTLAQYFFRTTQLNLNGISGSGGYVTGSNEITLEVGNNYDFGSGTVTGVFVWWGAKEIIGQADSIRINVYATGNDSLPTGAAIRSIKISTQDIDTAFTGNLLDDAGFYTFPNPAPVTGRFAVTIEVDGANINDTLGVLSNAQGNGAGEGRAIMKAANSSWLHMYEVWTFSGGQAYNADLMIFPVVNIPGVTASPTASSTNVCPGGTVNLAANAVGCSPTLTYSWSGTGISNPTSATPSANIPAGATGTLTYSVTVTDPSNGSTATGSVNVVVRAITVNAGSDVTINCGATTNLTATVGGTTTGFSAQWSNSVSGLANNNVGGGSYIITVTNSFGCTARDTVNVITSGCPLTASINGATISGCEGSQFTVTASTSGGTMPYTYSWSTTSGSLSCNNCPSPVLTFGAPGNGTITLVVTDNVGATVTASGPITSVAGPAVVFSPSNAAICSGQSQQISVTSPNGTVNWSTGASGSSINVTAAGNYSVTVTAGSGCVSRGSINVAALVTPPTPTIVGDANIVPGVTYTYTVSQQAGIVYNWIVQGGAITSGNGTNSVEVVWGSVSPFTIIAQLSDLTGACTSGDTITVFATGIEADLPGTSLSVYPNPVQNKLTVDFSTTVAAGYTVKLLSVNGAMVMTQNVTAASGKNTYEFDLSGTAAGLYMLTITDAQGKITGLRRLVVE